jgi:hypothetical protein
MFNLKNIYNNLHAIEINSLFCRESYFIVQDSLNFVCDKNLKLQNCSIRLLTKFTIKTFLFSNLFTLKTLKFPVYIIYIGQFFKFEDLFLKLFISFSLILFLKHKKQIFSFEYKKPSLFFDFASKVEFFTCVNNNYFNLLVLSSFPVSNKKINV